MDADLALMRRIDELHLELPFAGSRILRDVLRQDGHAVGRKHLATLMGRMGIEALYRKANTSRRHPEHLIYPHLLRGLTVDPPSQVWVMDIPYVPMQRGFVDSWIRPWYWIEPPGASWVAAVEQPDRRLMRRGTGGSDHAPRRVGDDMPTRALQRTALTHRARERLWKTIK